MCDICIDTFKDGLPDKGKKFAAIFPHSDDFTINATGLICKLIRQGYEGYFIRITNDEKDAYNMSIGETIYTIERETYEIANFLRIKRVFDLNYKNHYLNHGQLTEIRHRLITIFRYLRIDTVISFDPWGHYEENPDHYLTGMAVEQACWMSGRHQDLPELNHMGLKPHFVTEKYYVARGPQLVNLAIDFSDYKDIKKKAISMNATPVNNMYTVYKNKYTGFSKDMLSESEFIDEFLIQKDCLERFHYISPESF